MGDLQAWPQPNGNLTEEKESSSSANPNPSSIDGKLWALLEERASEIILCVHPTLKSEQRRNEVIDYVQRLIQGRIGCKVFPFGSVPLKTYLPDGDVDLTTFSSILNIEDKWANDVRAVLEGEETSKAAEFRVREVHYIKAEVKLVKCLVENIVVDISFNQLGGLSTLCFLEKVDRLIGKDHLFKRSIILVKAWCYYESRLLGAHHALISTYALETLVLYIFNRFHASLHGPLEVLYRFLDYFSKFDWENYCVSLQGPVSISALPVIVAEPPETDGAELLLNEEFLKSCSDLYSVLPKSHDNQNRSLTPKSLNIIDPLRENNNLGRSVSKGNFFRIRSAFGYGARMLGKVLLASEEKIAEELDKFFQNTLLRHGKGQRPDVPDSTVYSPQSRPVGENTSFLQSLKSDVEHKELDNNVLTQRIKTGERDGHSTESSEIAGFVPDVVYASRQFVGNETGQGVQSSCLCSTLSNCSPRINNELASTENLVSGSWMSGDVKDLVNNHSDCFRSKSPCILPENGISRHCCYCKASENMKSKAVTVSFSEDSKLFASHCQGQLSSKDARNGANHGGTLNSCMDCPCEHYDHQSASCIEKLSIDTASIQQGCTVANPRYMMPNTSQRDFFSSHVQNPKSLVQSTQPELFLSAPVASVSVSYPSVPVGHPEPMNVQLQNPNAFLQESSLHLGEVVHDYTLLEPGIGGNSLDNGPLENGNIQEGEIPLLVLKPDLSSTVTESSKQAMCSEESFIGNSKVDQDNLDCVNVGNPLTMIDRDGHTGCHVLYPEKKDEVCQCPEHLLQRSMDSDSCNSNMTTQASASPLPSFGCNGPAYTVYSHPMQADYQKTSLEESPSISGKLSQCSLSSNLSEISRLSDNTTFKSPSVPFSLDGTQPSLESGYLFNKPQESLKDWQGGKGHLPSSRMQRIAVDALRCQKPDLTADFDSHLNNLNFGKWCLESGMQSPVLQQPMMPPYMKEKYIPDSFVRPFPPNANMFPYIHGGYRVGPVSPFFNASGYRGSNAVILPGNFPVEDLPKPRSGTGTYFPNTSISPYKERPSNRGRYQGAPAQDYPPRVSSQMNRFRSNGRNKTTFDQPLHRQIGNKSSDVNSVGVRYGDKEGDVSNLCKSSYQAASNTVLNPMLESVSHDVYPSSKMTGHAKVSISPKARHSNPSVYLMRSHSTGSGFSSEQVEFGSLGPVPLGAVSPVVKSDESRHMDSDQLNGQLLGSGSEVANTSIERITLKPGALSNNGREASSSSLLKEDDFPPLPFQRQHGTSSGNAGSNGNSNNKGSHWQTSMTTS
ncbi:uncharacterized protein LOC131076031 [Cryptomeria japonica]|uniref:uncharacterized protein LOC131076031 n=1 Tax=Cryptomeria japonica TaxID=3369 RepID=UPI0027D9F9BB|nr:uncharacterized protein LOC131076031 [Cryptomeria japonica]